MVPCRCEVRVSHKVGLVANRPKSIREASDEYQAAIPRVRIPSPVEASQGLFYMARVDAFAAATIQENNREGDSPSEIDAREEAVRFG